MIKKFVAKGLMGIPDCDIELGEEKLIIIKGPNGSGKTSLLKQITHPYSSHDRYNRLRDGEYDGYIIKYFDYKGVQYKSQHIYTREKKNTKVLSYLSKKVGEEWVELVNNGLPSKFNEVCIYELEYDKYLYDILNIGVSNKGIVEGTNVERVEYLKKILKLEVLNSIKDNVLNNIKESNGSLKYIKNKLEGFTPLQEMVKEMKEIKDKTLSLESNLSLKEKQLSKINIEDMDDDLHIELSYAENDLKDIKALLKVLNKVEGTVSYNDVNNALRNKVTELQVTIKGYDSHIDRIGEELNKLHKIDDEKLRNEKLELEKKIKEIEEKYKDIKYEDLDIEELNYQKRYLERFKDILSDNDITQLAKYKDNPSLLKKEFDDRYNKLKEDILDSENKLNGLNLSTNLVNKEVPNDCKITTCPLRLELDRQLKELNVYNLLEDKIKRDKEAYDMMTDEKTEVYRKADVLERLLNLNEESIIKVSFEWNQDALESFYSDVLNKKFYYDDNKDMERMYNRLYEIDSILDNNDKSYNEKYNSLIEDLNKYRNLTEEYKSELNKVNGKINEIDVQVNNFNLLHQSKDTIINKTLPEVQNTISKLSEKIKRFSNQKTIKSSLEREILSLREELQSITERYYYLKNTIEESAKVTKEYEVISKDIDKLNILKEIINKKLPGKILENYLFDISTTVNNLLEDFLTIRFTVDEGIDIIINREGIERRSTDLSQGEKSMLAMALLLAFKKSISWDIISLDELDATLDETNRNKFIYMVRDYSDLIPNLNQIFIVTHTDFNDEGIDAKIINL